MATPPGGQPYEGARQPTEEDAGNGVNEPHDGGRYGPGGYQTGSPQGPDGPQAPYPRSPSAGGAPRQNRPPQPQPVPAADSTQGRNPLVRPYTMTGGRTQAQYRLAIETLVSTTVDPSHLGGLLPERRHICELCREVKSIAEISALLSIPLGVARILVADLAHAGLVAVHQPGYGQAGTTPDVALLERVLSGLRKL